DGPKLRPAEYGAVVRREEICLVPQVEELRAKLDPAPFAPERKNLRDRKGPDVKKRPPVVREEASDRTECETRRVRERGRVEVAIDPLFHAAGCSGRLPGAVRSLGSAEGIGRVGVG